jgi:thiol-disulfide isomerase/thioredoxin
VSERAEDGARPRRLWLLVVVLGVAVGGAWYSTHRHSSAVTDDVVFGGGRPQFLEFGMGVCAQCKRMKPVMERAARELGGGLDVHVLDIRQEKNEQLAERFKMTSMPLVVLVDGAGKELWRHDGFVDYATLSSAVRERLSTFSGICAPYMDKCEP